MTVDWLVWGELLLLPLLLIGWLVCQSQGPQRKLREVATRFPALRASLGPYPVMVLSKAALARGVAPLARRKSWSSRASDKAMCSSKRVSRSGTNWMVSASACRTISRSGWSMRSTSRP